MTVAVVVVSCASYSDAWTPFFSLLRKFWPLCPYPIRLITDTAPTDVDVDEVIQYGSGRQWCEVVGKYAETHKGEVSILAQEDFFLTNEVRQNLITYGLNEMKERRAGAVRLYPCPGADEDYGDEYFGIVDRRAAYRVSCQITAFENSFLHAVASQCRTPRDFEIAGTYHAARYLPDEVLAFKREVEPWPIQYLCSAISRGKWEPDAKKLCDSLGIEGDWSRRPFKSC